MFAQTQSADSLYYEQSLVKDSVQVDDFIRNITESNIYNVVDKIKNGTVSYYDDMEKIITVKVYKDSIYMSYIPLSMSFQTFNEATFYKRSTHWYYYCTRSDRQWAILGMNFISIEIDKIKR